MIPSTLFKIIFIKFVPCLSTCSQNFWPSHMSHIVCCGSSSVTRSCQHHVRLKLTENGMKCKRINEVSSSIVFGCGPIFIANKTCICQNHVLVVTGNRCNWSNYTVEVLVQNMLKSLPSTHMHTCKNACMLYTSTCTNTGFVTLWKLKWL